MKLLKGIGDDFRRSLLTLKNSIDSELKQKSSRIVMFTSAVEGEGKTMIVSSLARILALGESDRVLLVDCAVNKPDLPQLFGIKGKRGLLDYLAGEASMNRIVNSMAGGKLDIIVLGSTKGIDIAQPLLESDRMDFFFKEASEAYDYILLDTSAILEAPETPIIGSFADGIVLVIHTGRTKREVIKRAMMNVEKLDGKFLGSVLNRKRYYIPEFIYRRV